MRSNKSPFHPRNFSMDKHLSGISMLLLILIGFVFQGCVVHNHERGYKPYVRSAPVEPRVNVVNPAPVTFTFSNHHRYTVQNYYHRHPHYHNYHGKKYKPRQQWKYNRKHYLPRGIQMRGIPVDLSRQLPSAPRGTRYIYVDDQVLLVNVNTRLVLDFINIQMPVEQQEAYTRKPAPKTVDQIPSHEEQHPAHSHQPPSQARAYEVSQGKPFTEDEHPSSHGQGHNGNKGKPDMSEDHPSSHGQGHKVNKGKPYMGDDHPSSHAQNNQVRNKGGYPKPSSHAKVNKGNRSGPQQDNQDRHGGPAKGHERLSQDKSNPAMESADGSGSHQMEARGKPDKAGPKGKGEQKDRGSTRKPSDQEDSEQFQPNPEPEENTQIANAEPGRGKGKSKGPGKANKMKRDKREQQTETTATQQETITIASFAPVEFDNNQRSIIQSYYQNSGSKRSGKGRERKSRGPKRNKTSSVTKNDVLTQPTESLPQSLESQLPSPPHNTQRVLYNQQVLLIERGTNKVLDVINVNN